MKMLKWVVASLLVFTAIPAFAASSNGESQAKPTTDSKTSIANGHSTAEADAGETTNQRQYRVEAILGYFSEPSNTGFGSAAGLGVGGAVSWSETTDIFADIRFAEWRKSASGFDWKYRRMPVALGLRHFFTGDKIQLYGEGGAEASFDKTEICTGSYCIDLTSSKTTLGFMIGGGMVTQLGNDVLFRAGLRYHGVTDPYMSIDVGVILAF